METFNGIILPFWGTVIGSFLVFFIKQNINERFKLIILCFSSGIMLSSAIWSLFIPALEESNNIIIPIIGFLLGVFFLLIINIYYDSEKAHKNKVMILSIVLHNIPEGMAVGVAFASILNNYMNYQMAFILSLGIAIQNIPEGSIISIPLFTNGISKAKSFFIGCLSGIVEPIGALVAFIITSKVIVLLPWILSFAAGTMIYVVIQDILPDCNHKLAIIPFSFGFLLMIILECLF